MSVHCDAVADNAVVTSTAAKKHEVSPTPTGRGVKLTAGQNTAPKFGLLVTFLCN